MCASSWSSSSISVCSRWGLEHDCQNTSPQQTKTIARTPEAIGLEDDILDSTGMKAGPVDTVWKHCAERAGVITVANLLGGLLSYEVGRTRRKRNRWFGGGINVCLL